MLDKVRRWRIAPVALLALAVSACSNVPTGYQATSGNPLLAFSAGYQEQAAPGGLVKVTYHGDRSMLMYQVEDYTLYRCAELAQRERKPYFALYQTLADALTDRRSAAVEPTTLRGIPHAEVYIRLHHEPGAGLLSSAEVLSRLGPSVLKGAS